MNSAPRLKTVVVNTALVLATLTVLYVVYRLGQVILLFVLSIIVAAALRKNVLWLEDRGVPRALAILLYYALIVGVIGLGIYLMGNQFQAEIKAAGNRWPGRYDALVQQWKASPSGWQATIGRRLPTTGEVFTALGKTDPTVIGFGLLGLTYGIADIGISLVAVLSLTFYWLSDQERFERLWLTLLPVQQRSVARTTWRETETKVGAFVRSEATQFVLTIAILWLTFQLIGLPYATLVALYAGLAQLIPWLGVPLTLVPLVPLFFATPLVTIVIAAVVIIAVGIFMDKIAEPYLSKGASAHPVLVIVALLVMAQASGLVGMIIALPLAATAQIVVSAIIRANSAAKDTSANQEAAQVQELRARMVRIHAELPDDLEQRRAIEGMLGRLDGLLAKTEGIVQDRSAEAQRTRRVRPGTRPASIFQRRSS